MTFVTKLTCLRCGETYAPDPGAYVCEACGGGDDPGILDVGYDYEGARAAREERGPTSRAGLSRYADVLPLEPEATLPAGGTPLAPAPRLASRLGLDAVYLKDETRNPTRCLKDRATAIGVGMALARGHSDVYCASAGNAAISLAGFAAHAGLGCHVFVPRYASPVRLGWLHRFGADVHVSDGDYDRAYEESEEAGRRHGWYSRNCALNPFLVEGKKTVAHEIAEQLGGRVPDWVVAPVGDGCTLGGIGKGFREAVTLGVLGESPRLLGVQADAVQPLVRPDGGAAEGDTRAVSMAVRAPRNRRRVLAEVDRSGGTMVAVSDSEIAAAQGVLAREAGVVAEFTSAATLAGIGRLAEEGRVAGGTAVLVITGGRLDEGAGAERAEQRAPSA